MVRVFFNKLVRDGIQSKIESKGEAFEIRTITDANELQNELLKKVAEEALELSKTKNREEFLQEYADVMVALDSLTSHMEFSEADIKTAIEENVAKKGFFKEKHFLVWSEFQDGTESGK